MSKRPSWAWQLVKIADRGWAAFEAGKKREDNPYKWARTGFAAQRYKYWNDGFDFSPRRIAS